MTITSHRDVGGSLVVQVGPGALDRARNAARAAAYPNTETERRVIDAYDQATFDRVRGYEQRLIGNANALHDSVAGSPAVPGSVERSTLGDVDSVVSDIYALVGELERGASASEVAERFEALRRRAEHVVLPQVALAQRSINDYYMPRLQDPYLAAENVIAIMPRSSFRPVDPSPYLD